MNEIIEEIKLLNVGKMEENVSLKKYTTYRAGGNARCIVYPKNTKSLVNLLSFLKERRVPHKILGNGSNLLFSDKDYEGVLIRLNEFDKIKFINKRKIRVGAGYPLIKLSLVAAKKGLTGLEFAAGIPGTVGGAIYMNAGAYKSDMSEVIKEVTFLDENYKLTTLLKEEMQFHYRSSFLQTHPGYVCLEVVLELKHGKRDAIEEVIRDRRQRRLESQPLEYPSAGSVFRNPPDNFAGKLIEDAGLKGMTKGGAMVSSKHANFIVNYQDAKASDIKYLIDTCHDKVLKEYGIDMKIEQEFVNWE